MLPARRDRAAAAVTAAAVRKAVTGPQAMRPLHRRRLARAAASLAARDAAILGLDPALASRAVRVASRDADATFTAAVNAAHGRRHRDGRGALGAAQAVLDAAAASAQPRDPAARAHLLAAAAITPAAKHQARAHLARLLAAGRMPTLHLGRLTGIWAAVYRRRDSLLARHAKTVAAAWDACIAELDTRDLVREYRRPLSGGDAGA